MKKLLTLIAITTFAIYAQDPLPSWNDSKAKQNIVSYVNTVTKTGTPDFIPVSSRIAVFDNDGTLWSEQPIYFQLLYVFDRVKELAPKHPEWKTTQPYKSVLENNLSGLKHSGMKGILEIYNVSHSGMDMETYQEEARKWLESAKHPTKDKLYPELTYLPMKELIKYLKANDFDVFIVSGGGIDFMRAFLPEMYDIPSDHIIGSIGNVHYENGHIIKDKDVSFIDDHKLKPIGIYHAIGKRPVAAFGNSDGDLEMMQYTEANKKYKTLQLYVHHTDAAREWAYDRKSLAGKLDKGLDYGKDHNWTFVDMKNDWNKVY